MDVIETSASTLPNGQRKFSTVLFADLCDSTALVAPIDPEDAQRLLDLVSARMAEAVRTHGGTVVQFTGDGLVALFGAPVAQEDHIALACQAALALHRAVATIGADGSGPGSLLARVGLHAGPVVVHQTGDAVRIYGQTAYLAARLEQNAPPGGTLVSETTARLIDHAFETAVQAPVTFKGFAKPVPARRLIAATPGRSRLQIALSNTGLTPLAGRKAELDALRSALRQAADGAGSALTLIGEPGAGKSRLAHELAKAAGHCLCLIAYAEPHGATTPYEPVIGLLSRYLGVKAWTESGAIRAALEGRLAALDPALADAAAPLLWLLGADATAADPALQRQAATAALCRVLLAESHRRPLLLVVEDLQWADEGTAAMLDALVRRVGEGRILLLATCRPGYPRASQPYPGWREMRLAPLAAGDAEAMLQALLGADPGLEPLKQVLIRQAAGNPFFIEEIVRSLVETGALVGPPGGYTAPRPTEDIEIPASVQAILAARIDRLSAPAKRVLQAAAIVGEFSGRQVLQAIVAQDGPQLAASLDELARAELLLAADTQPEPLYRFKHGLVQDVTQTSLLREQRAALHAAALRTLEVLRPGTQADLAAALARHAAGAEAWDAAAGHMHHAGTLATERSAHRAALSFFEDALVALGKRPGSRARQQRALELHLAARNALWTVSDHDAIIAHLRHAEALALALGDRKQLGRISSFMIQHHRTAGEPDRAIAAGERAIQAATALGDADLLIETRFRLGMTCLTIGEYASGARLFEENITELDRGRSHERIGLPGITAVLSRAWLAVCLAELGQYDAAIVRAREGIAIAQPADPGYSLVSALYGLANAELLRGATGAAGQVAQAALELCERHAMTVLSLLLRFVIGCVHLEEGRPAAAIGQLEIAAEIGRTRPALARRTLFLARLGAAYLGAGRIADAERIAAAALADARKRHERGHEAWVLWLVAEIAAAKAPGSAGAQEAQAAAAALAGTLGMQPLLHRITRGTVGPEPGLPGAAQAASGLVRPASLTRVPA